MMGKKTSILPLIKRGGIHYNVEGDSKTSALLNLFSNLRLPPSCDARVLTSAILEREELMSTCIGSGIAIPHPRTPLLKNADEQFIAFGLLKNPLDWQALDKQKVHSLILIVSSGAREHLAILSFVNYLAQKQRFRDLLSGKAPGHEIEQFIADIENE
jgi:PTS system nitrogen regulatory IIA component